MNCVMSALRLAPKVFFSPTSFRAAERKRRRQIHVIDSGDQQNDHRDGDEDLDVLDIAGLPQELHTCTIEMDLRERKESIGEGLNVLVGKVPHFARFDLRCKILKIRAVPHQDVGVEGLVPQWSKLIPRLFNQSIERKTRLWMCELSGMFRERRSR